MSIESEIKSGIYDISPERRFFGSLLDDRQRRKPPRPG